MKPFTLTSLETRLEQILRNAHWENGRFVIDFVGGKFVVSGAQELVYRDQLLPSSGDEAPEVDSLLQPAVVPRRVDSGKEERLDRTMFG